MSERLRREIRQSKPFANAEEEAYVALLRTADAHQQRVAELLKGHDLSPVQYNVLRILRGAGEGGLSCGEISERMITRDPDVTRLLDRLEKQGWVVRQRDQTDRRVVKAMITDLGKRLIAPLDAVIADHHRTHLGHLERKRLQQLVELLDAARQPPA